MYTQPNTYIPYLKTIKKLKDPENMANDLNTLFTAVIEKLNLHQVRNEEAISFLKETFPGNIHGHIIIPTTQTEKKHT